MRHGETGAQTGILHADLDGNPLLIGKIQAKQFGQSETEQQTKYIMQTTIKKIRRPV